MIELTTTILQFNDQGEKTGWSYIEIPADLAQEIKPGNKKSFRVRGMLDGLAVKGMALTPMGEGAFIMALKADIRKAIHKNAGAVVHAKLEEDVDYKVDIPQELQDCLDFDADAQAYFDSLPRSHRDYFLKWIEQAKTAETRAKRIVNTTNAMMRKWPYNVMIKEIKKE